MRHLGDFIKGATVRFAWNTSGADGASITRATNGTLYVYKDGTLTTEVTTGVTDTEDGDALTGVHVCEIVTTDAFYSVGSEFLVVLKAATIDGVTVNAALAQFSIQRATSMKPVVGTAQGGAVGYVDLPTAASSTDGAYAGAFVRVKHSGGAVEVRRQSSTAYVGASRRFSVDPNFAVAPDSSSEVELYLLPPNPASNVPNVNASHIGGAAQTPGDLTALLATVQSTATLLVNATVVASGTIGSTGNDTTHLHLSGLAFADDGVNNLLVVFRDVSTGLVHPRWIGDWVASTDVATLGAALPVTPENGIDTYVVVAVRQDVAGGSGLDADGIRTAVGLSSANLETLIATVGALVEVVDMNVDDIKGITDLLTLAAIGQQVLKATTLTLGNKLFIDGTDIVLTDTDGTTEIGRVPYLRLEAPANPLASVGGS